MGIVYGLAHTQKLTHLAPEKYLSILADKKANSSMVIKSIFFVYRKTQYKVNKNRLIFCTPLDPSGRHHRFVNIFSVIPAPKTFLSRMSTHTEHEGDMTRAQGGGADTYAAICHVASRRGAHRVRWPRGVPCRAAKTTAAAGRVV